MAQMYVISNVRNTAHMAGIPHSHAIANLNGAAIFAFRQISTATRLARLVDQRITDGEQFVFTEDLLTPFSNLYKGLNLQLKPGFNPYEKRPLENVVVGRVKEHEVIQYCAAMQISAVFLSENSSHDSIYVEEILSPARSIEFSAGYLDYLYNKSEDEGTVITDEENRD